MRSQKRMLEAWKLLGGVGFPKDQEELFRFNVLSGGLGGGLGALGNLPSHITQQDLRRAPHAHEVEAEVQKHLPEQYSVISTDGYCATIFRDGGDLVAQASVAKNVGWRACLLNDLAEDIEQRKSA